MNTNYFGATLKGFEATNNSVSMSREEVIFEVLQATGLNWSVRREKIVGETSGLVVPDKVRVFRSDNGSYLGCVGDGYTTLQNADMVSIVYDSASEVFCKEKELTHPWNNSETLGSFGNMGGGSLKGGSRVFVQLELPQKYIGKSGINRFITGTNGHDGTLALGFGTSNQVVCCANTFAIANRDLAKIKHTASMQQKIDEAVKSLRKVLEFEERQMEVFEIASNRAFNKSHIEDIVKAVFGKSVDSKTDEVSTRMKNQMTDFASDINKSIEEQGETLWALFNGVTRYTNHTTKAKDKDFGLMFGTEAQTNQRAYETMVSWLKEPALELVAL
jgi:phage/plasmid-like protein (TIGR03299 family)